MTYPLRPLLVLLIGLGSAGLAVASDCPPPGGRASDNLAALRAGCIPGAPTAAGMIPVALRAVPGGAALVVPAEGSALRFRAIEQGYDRTGATPLTAVQPDAHHVTLSW